MQCRFCGTDQKNTFVNLGMSPLCESYVSEENVNKMEPFYPLHVYVCDKCYLVQLEEFVSPEHIFTEYAYFSSYATSWVEHAKNYTDMIVERLDLSRDSHVVELASNDGYLLQHFLKYEIPVLGIEPAINVAKVAREKNINTLTEFFGVELAEKLVKENQMADLVIGNNVLAQVPDINDFVQGMKILLKPSGVITMEFPHLLKLIKENQFDTIYHEHFSYFSWYSVEKIFKHHGLRLFDVEQIPTHGGSLRIYACHEDDSNKQTSAKAQALMAEELQFGVNKLSTYSDYTEQVEETKRKILDFLIATNRDGKKVVGYGAPGKGNTLLNYCGVRTDFLDYTVDRNPYKQGMYLPGTHIPIHHPDKIKETRPDYVFILPWNFKDEIIEQNAFIREWGGQFVIPIPELEVVE